MEWTALVLMVWIVVDLATLERPWRVAIGVACIVVLILVVVGVLPPIPRHR